MFQEISAGRFHRCSFDFRSEAEFLKVSLCRCGDIIFPLRAELMAHTARVHFRAIVVGGLSTARCTTTCAPSPLVSGRAFGIIGNHEISARRKYFQDNVDNFSRRK
jgi:hypothetical protein